MAQAGATFHPHNPAGITYKSLLLNKGSVADVKYFSQFVYRRVPVDIKSLSELALTVELVSVNRPELGWTKKS